MKEPIFRQIAKHFESLIIEGKLAPGEPLPAERKFAEELGVNRSTVVSAYAELRATGLVQSVQGSGTRVSERMWGVSARKVPNWRQYTLEASFRPTLPLISKLRSASTDPTKINLARGELSEDLLPRREVQELLHRMNIDDSLGYSHPQGSLRLRETLCDHLRKANGIYTDPEHILITSGSQQALHLITQCLLAPGDAIGLEGPSYAYSLPLFSSAGLRLFRIPVDDDGLDPISVKELYQKHMIKMVFVNPTYQNPTGTTLSLSRRKQLLEICEELRIPIVEDGAYSEIRLDKSEAPSNALVTLHGNSDLVIYVGSLSKTAAPGLRIGWVIAPSAVIRRMADAKEQMDFGMNTVVQELANLYLRTGWRDHLQRLTRELTKRRNSMLMSLQSNAEELCVWNKPLGGYHIWCRLKHIISDAELLDACIQNGVIVTLGIVYGLSMDSYV
ncbi:PLP-dependent aminotransferase family protein [Alicyclobacillus acidoterrestris]|nr:PLP-dependent aminotransferase family protein [Alicyclobacillus acidoterrestris]